MPIINGEIYCKCGEKIDKQLIKDILLSEIKINEEATVIQDKIKSLMDDIEKLNNENKKFENLYKTIQSLELLIDELGDIKLSRLIRIATIIEKNVSNPLYLKQNGEDKHYQRNYSISVGKSNKGEIQLKYEGDLLKAYVLLYGIGENNFTINEERVIEVLHYIESINCKKE